MALTKRLYKNHETVITAQNMNDIQDAILALEEQAGIVPGEGETTKIINVINPAGSLTAAQAATLPDGIYWAENPIAFQSEDQADELLVEGLTSKHGLTWYVYDSWSAGTTDESGVLVDLSALASSPAVQSIDVAKSDSTIVIGFNLEDGTTSTHTILLENDVPTTINIDGVSIPMSWEGFE